MRTGPEYFESVLHDLHVQYTAFLMRTVREAVHDGELPAGTDPELVRSLVYGGIEHRLWAALYGRGGRIDVEAMADSWTEVVLHGIQPARAQRGPRSSKAASRAWRRWSPPGPGAR